VPEQAEAAQTERVGDGGGVGDQAVERVGGLPVRMVALAVAAVVEDDRGGVLGEARHLVGEVLLGATEAVDQQERGPVAGDLDGQPDAVVHLDAHPRLPTLRSRPAASS
jgi:hypothetical protein